LEKDEIPAFIQHSDIQVLATMGAGDIDKMVNQIKEILQNKN
jgi:hypothetical protein